MICSRGGSRLLPARARPSVSIDSGSIALATITARITVTSAGSAIS